MPGGRPRKSLADHLRDGTYRPDRHGPRPGETANVQVPVSSCPPDKPHKLTPAQSAIWDQLTELLAGVVTDRDADSLKMICIWLSEFQRVQMILQTMTPGQKGYKDTLVSAGICSANYDKLASKFGLTPADRSKLKVVEVGPPVAKVPTKPKTKLDLQGPPKRE